MSKRDIVFVDGARTAFGTLGKTLRMAEWCHINRYRRSGMFREVYSKIESVVDVEDQKTKVGTKVS